MRGEEWFGAMCQYVSNWCVPKKVFFLVDVMSHWWNIPWEYSCQYHVSKCDGQFITFCLVLLAVLRIRITLMRIRILPFTLMRIRIHNSGSWHYFRLGYIAVCAGDPCTCMGDVEWLFICCPMSGHSGKVAFFHGTYHPGDVSSNVVLYRTRDATFKNNVRRHFVTALVVWSRSEWGTYCTGIRQQYKPVK